MKTFVYYYLPLFSYTGLIFYLSSLPQPPQPLTFYSADKILHIVEYALLGILVINILHKHFPDQRNKWIKVLALILSTLYGISDEFHQYFIPSREASIFDVFADGIGSYLGIFLYTTVKGRK